MSDAPKKPVKRKATPKVAAAKLETKARGMSDQEMREAVLARALPHAAFDGFTDSVLQKAGDEAQPPERVDQSGRRRIGDVEGTLDDE